RMGDSGLAINQPTRRLPITRRRGTGTSRTVGRSGRSAWARPARYRVRYQRRPATKATVTRVWSTPMRGHRSDRGGRVWSVVPWATALSMASVRRSSSRSGLARPMTSARRAGGAAVAARRSRAGPGVGEGVDGAAGGGAAAPAAGVGDRVDRAGRGRAAVAAAPGPGDNGQEAAQGAGGGGPWLRPGGGAR